MKFDNKYELFAILLIFHTRNVDNANTDSMSHGKSVGMLSSVLQEKKYSNGY